MAKGMRSNLAMMYPLLFLIVAFLVYYLFRQNFKFREGKRPRRSVPEKTKQTAVTTQPVSRGRQKYGREVNERGYPIAGGVHYE
jgi:hypothetical protein